MIVSASYRTDIPAFYGDWFRRRLTAGFCRTVNPYGGGVYETRLTPEAVDGFVFYVFLPPVIGGGHLRFRGGGGQSILSGESSQDTPETGCGEALQSRTQGRFEGPGWLSWGGKEFSTVLV